MGGSCGSEFMEEGSELMDMDRSSWRRDQSSWMWIDLAGAGVLVCNLDGAWMNRALTVAWRGRGRRRGFDGAIVGWTGARFVVVELELGLFLLTVSLSLSLSLSLHV